MIFHSAPWVLPISAPPIADGVVAVDDRGVIRGIGRREDLRATGTHIAHTGVILPGLVNAHAHVELSGLARIPGGDGLAPWISRLLAVRATPDARAIEIAARQLHARGTVAVADVANTDIAAPILRAAGIEVLDLDERVALGKPLAPPRPGAVRTPHSVYTCGELSLSQIGRIASIHIEEDPAEAGHAVEGAGPIAELLRSRGAPVVPVGKRPLPFLDELGLIGEGTLLVHLTFADDSSLRRAAARKAVAVLCPRSNRHITGHLPPFARMRELGLRVALGSDSLASSPTLDVLGDVQCLVRAGAVATWLLQASTLHGANALRMPHLGALEPGRRPGIIKIGDRPVPDPVAFVANEGADAPVERLA
jgi:cytosine/adenosine deaminase-related metal-dependent hydrolase